MRKKSVIVCFVIIIVTILGSCKKDTNNPTPSASSNPPQSSSIYKPTVYGVFQATRKQYYDKQTFLFNDSTAVAAFFSIATDKFDTITYRNAGIVKYNNVQLHKLTIGAYEDSTKTVSFNSNNWNVSGSTFVPPINYSYTPNFPSFNGNNILPDSISLSNGISININGKTNGFYNVAKLQLWQSSAYVEKTIPFGQTQFTFTSTDLSSFTPNTNTFLLLALRNGHVATFSGKDYSFENLILHFKDNIKMNP